MEGWEDYSNLSGRFKQILLEEHLKGFEDKITNSTLIGAMFDNEAILQNNLVRCTFKCVDFNCSIDYTNKFTDCIFDLVDFRCPDKVMSAEYNNCKFTHCNFEDLKCMHTNGCIFDNCDFSSGWFDECEFTDCVFNECNFDDASFNNMEIENCMFDECMFTTHTKGLNAFSFNHCTITHTIFGNLDFIILDGTSFEKCSFNFVSPNTIENTTFTECHFNRINRVRDYCLQNCTIADKNYLD